MTAATRQEKAAGGTSTATTMLALRSAGAGRRIGLMIPANNSTMERELLAWLPSGSTCQTLRIPRGPGLLRRETISSYLDAAMRLARQFEPGLDLIVYGCTAASFIAGIPADEAMRRDLSAMHAATPVITTAGSMLAELRAHDVRRIALVTPYADDVNEALVAMLAEAGMVTATLERLPVENVEALGRLTADDVGRAVGRIERSRFDAVFVACSQLPTEAVIRAIGPGTPVFSSIQATAAQAMRPLPTRQDAPL